MALAPDPPFPLPILLLLLFVTFVVNHQSKIYKNEIKTNQINLKFLSFFINYINDNLYLIQYVNIFFIH